MWSITPPAASGHHSKASKRLEQIRRRPGSAQRPQGTCDVLGGAGLAYGGAVLIGIVTTSSFTSGVDGTGDVGSEERPSIGATQVPRCALWSGLRRGKH